MRGVTGDCCSSGRQPCDLAMINDLYVVRFQHWGSPADRLRFSLSLTPTMTKAPMRAPDQRITRRATSRQSRPTARAAAMLPERGWWCKLAHMPPTKVGKLAPVTLGHMRSQGCRDLLVYCNSDRCNHSTIMNVGHLPDETPIKSLGEGFVGPRGGVLGGEVVPNCPPFGARR